MANTIILCVDDDEQFLDLLTGQRVITITKQELLAINLKNLLFQNLECIRFCTNHSC